MADDETQGPEVTSWWTSDALHDSSLPSATFDEPLVWPEFPAWDGAAAADGGFDALVEPGDDGAPLAVPPDSEPDAQWRPSGESADADAPVRHDEPLAGLGGGAGSGGGRSGEAAPNVRDDLPWPAAVGSSTAEPHSDRGARPAELGSIWSNDFRSEPENLVGFAGLPAPAIYADTERSGGGRRWPRIDVRPGNAAVIGLISVVSLVLLGMFLSVRARNDTPTDASQVRPAGDEISVTGPLSTVPLPTSVTSTSTTTTVVASINIAELLPPAETAGATPATGSAGSGSGTSTATTAPLRTAAAPTGSGTATTTATTQPAATPAPPATTNVTSPPATSPPDTEPPDTTPPATTPTTARPTPTVPPVSITMPTFTIPTFPGLPVRDRDN